MHRPMWEKGGIIYALHGSIQRTYHVYVQWLLQDRHALCGYQADGGKRKYPQDFAVPAKENGGAFAWRIRIAAIENGHIDRDTEDSIKQRLVAALFKFRFDEQEV